MEQLRQQLYISADLEGALKRFSRAEHVSESELLRRALENYFQERETAIGGDPLLRTIGLGTSKGEGTGSVDHDEIYRHVR